MKRPLIAVAAFILVLTIIRLSIFPGNEGKIRKLLSPYVEGCEVIGGTGVISEVRLSEKSVRYYVKSVKLEHSGSVIKSDSGFVISFFRDEFNIDNADYELIPGAVISFIGVPAFFESAANDGGYDEAKDMYAKGMVAKISQGKLSVIKRASWIRRKLWDIRKNVSSFYRVSLDDKSAGVLSSVCLGDKEYLSSDLRDDYGRAGMSHVLAISGLHISIFGVCVYEFLRRRGVSFVGAAVVAVISVLLYVTMAGVTVSSLRALIMFVISMGANVLGRKYDGLNAGFLSFCIIVLWDPRYMLQVAFMYSFAAVMGIYLVGELIDAKYRRINPILRMLASSAAVCIMTFPITAYSSFEVPIYAVLLNLIIIPLVTPLLISGVLAGIMSYVSYYVAGILLIPGKYILLLFNWIADTYGKIPGSTAVIGRPNKVLVFLYFGGVLVIYFGMKRKWQCGLGIIGLILMLILPNRFCHDEMTFLYVGQGDGIYIETAKGYRVMIDGGSTSMDNVGENVIRKYLSYHGRDGIDMWFVSHYDTDHISGLIELLHSKYSINAIFLAKSDESVKYREIVSLAKQNGVKVYIIDRLTEIKMGKDRILALPVSGESTNDTGIIIRMDYERDGFDAVFAGDISSEEELLLLKMPEALEIFSGVDVYKAIHHGSRNSNSSEILALCNPKTIVISCGRNNRYGHPHAEALERMSHYTRDIRITAGCGQVRLGTRDGPFHTILQKKYRPFHRINVKKTGEGDIFKHKGVVICQEKKEKKASMGFIMLCFEE